MQSFSAEMIEVARDYIKTNVDKQGNVKESNMTEKQAINLGLKALSAANDNNLKAEVIEIAVISTEREFGTLDPKVVSGEIKKIK